MSLPNPVLPFTKSTIRNWPVTSGYLIFSFPEKTQKTHYIIEQLSNRAVHSRGGQGGKGEGDSCPRQENQMFFSNIVFESAELFLVAILGTQ